MNLKKLFVSLAVCLGSGGIGSFFTSQSLNSWYAALAKPAFTPPSWVFGPVWTVLYILMGISLYVVWHRFPPRLGRRLPYSLFAAQLALNTAWSAVFFDLRSLVGGLVVITALWLAIFGTMTAFRRLSRLAGWLLIPYLAWVTFAFALNYSIWKLNR